MKTFLTLCASALLVLASNVSSFAGEQDFTLVNATGVEIHNLHVSPHEKNSWGPDILGKDTLPDGASAEIKFDADAAINDWDVRVADSKGNSLEWHNLDLTEISKVTLHYADGKATAEVE